MRRNYEELEQKALFKWASMYTDIYPYLFHIPNGGFRNPREAAKLKAMGVKAGVSDIFFARPHGSYAGLWIELKAQKGKVSQLQLEWLQRMMSVGYYTAVCVGWESAKNEIERYLSC